MVSFLIGMTLHESMWVSSCYIEQEHTVTAVCKKPKQLLTVLAIFRVPHKHCVNRAVKPVTRQVELFVVWTRCNRLKHRRPQQRPRQVPPSAVSHY